jgi:hypothetical protein
MYSADDLMLVADYATAKWLNDPKMCDYLRPKTLLVLRTSGVPPESDEMGRVRQAAVCQWSLADARPGY